MKDYILPFNKIDASSIHQVGGKGANLGEMARAGFPIPDGFCVTTTAYHAYIESFSDQIYALLEDLDPTKLDTIRKQGAAVRDLMGQHQLPSNVEQAIESALQSTDGKLHGEQQHPYAVRSSATAEDLPTASFAGQQDTFLNVIGTQELIEKTRQCFISLYSDRAILYRIQNNFPHHLVALSAVVQRMVMPRISGILFTADPITEHRGICSIDASFGLGEALVSGLVTADLFKVNKSTKEIISRKISTKKVAIQPIKTGGTKIIDIPKDQQNTPSLSDQQVLALNAIGSNIEAHYATPQDIEWAIQNDEIFITQSRPITSLYPQVTPQPPKGEHRIYVSISHLQVMTDPMPPLAISIWQHIPRLGLNANDEFEYLYDVGGRMYLDISPVLRHPLGKKILLKAMSIADRLTQAALVQYAKRPELFQKGERYNPLSILPRIWGILYRVPWNLLFAKTDNAISQANKKIEDYVQATRLALANPELSQRQKLDISLERLSGFFAVATNWIPKFIAGSVAQHSLVKLAGPKNASLITDLERGLEGNVVSEMNLTISDLADLGRASRPLAQMLNNSNLSTSQKLAKIKPLPGGEEFLSAWNDFLTKFGARGPSEIDASRPRWQENPHSLLQMIIGIMGQDEKTIHRNRYNELVQKSRAAAIELPKQVGFLKRPLVRRFVKIARDLSPLREHHKFLMVQMLAQTKQVLLDIAGSFQANGTISDSDDIWYLSISEIRLALEAKQNYQNKVKRRREQFEQDEKRTPPRVITDEGEIIRARLSVEGAPENALIGSPVAAGIYDGIAHVVRNPATETLAPGEVLVAAFTDPGWTPLFVNASALVTEVGGLMTHGSVVAREYGIPAVVGILDATTKIKTGDHIRVHADAGYVEILESQPL